MRQWIFVVLCLIAVSSCSSGTQPGTTNGIGKSVAYFVREDDGWHLVVNNRWKNDVVDIAVDGTPHGLPLLSARGNAVAFATDGGLFFAHTSDLRHPHAITADVIDLPLLSVDGRFVTFVSGSVDLVSDDTNGVEDVFIFDADTKRVRRASILPDGSQATAASSIASVSADGRYVVFRSAESLLVFDALKGVTTPAP